jgi:signal transduction histidine kinase
VDIYKRKSRIKILLLVASIAIAVVSLWYTNQLANKIASEEEMQVRIWAEALEKRANLVKITGELFEKIAQDQTKTIENWAAATSLIVRTDDLESITFLSKIITGNTNIPVILTNSNKEVVDTRNIEIPKGAGKEYLQNLLKTSFSQYKPIEIQFEEGKNYIYYSDSKIFTELKNTLNDLIESFILEVVINSASLPVILVDADNQLIASGNVDSVKILPENLETTLMTMGQENTPIELDLGDGSKRYVYYENSLVITQLKAFPFIQLFLFAILVGVAYLGFSSSRRAEQNRVWVGLAKETAHQLGTPISSLSAWIDYMKEMPAEAVDNEKFIQEVEKDVNRLTLVAERFSKIGSKPDLEKKPLKETLEMAVEYMKSRASEKVSFEVEIEGGDMTFEVNESLFNWVIENLIKNALDAMEGVGRIKIRAFKSSKNIVIDVIDSGKGIPKSNFETVFQPGFSTKKRGWGLGLSLVKRIIENYHQGMIYVKESSDKGTVFRIKLPLLPAKQ